jgi:hypothetical protein
MTKYCPRSLSSPHCALPGSTLAVLGLGLSINAGRPCILRFLFLLVPPSTLPLPAPLFLTLALDLAVHANRRPVSLSPLTGAPLLRLST